MEKSPTEQRAQKIDTLPRNCACCKLSRRSFIGTLSAAAMATSCRQILPLGSPLEGSCEDFIQLSDFRPRPVVRVRSAFVRLPPPYWLGWPGTAYDLEGHRRTYSNAFKEAAEEIGVSLQEDEQPIESDDGLNSFIQRIQAEKPDAVLLSLQHMGVWGWAGRIASTGIPTIIFAPVGTCFTGHILDISRRPGVHVVS